MIAIRAQVPTANAFRYMMQLCKHWAHKLEVDLAGDQGCVRFTSAEARFMAGREGLTVTVRAADPEILERMKDVVASHLDRFAFREAPLRFDWQPTEASPTA